MLTGSLDRVGHACEFETALAMHLRARENGMPTLVQERARDLPPRLMQPWIGPGSGQDPISAAGAAWPPIFQGDDCGYYGDPGAATPELGAKLFECVVAGLASFFDDFAGATLRLGQARGDTAPRLAEALWP
jgi:creatinine amidohydrolase